MPPMVAEFQRPLPYIDDDDESGIVQRKSDEVTQLYLAKLEPLVKRILANKFRVSLSKNDDRQQNQDALELLGEIKLLILKRLYKNCADQSSDTPTYLEAYVRSVTTNAFNQYLREKYPRRSSLQNQLRYVLTHSPKLAFWKDQYGRWICGPANRKDKSHPGSYVLTAAVRSDVLLCVDASKVFGRNRRVIDFAHALFDAIDHPITFDDLVVAACDLLQIDEAIESSESQSLCESVALPQRTSPQTVIEDRQFVERLWGEILKLPQRHRAALLLNFKEDGEHLIEMLPVFAIATIRQIADALGLEHSELAEIWAELPWDDNRIAKRFGLTRQQVINLRQSARQTLRRKMRL